MGDAELVEDDGVPMTAGERLRQAREASGVSLEEIATTTRIPTRHLESLEAGDFARLPAPTYTIGFAKNFAAAVGLDRTEIGDQLRAEMGGSRPAMTTPEVFEPADPARAMPKWLIFAAIAALILFALLYNWLNNRAVEPEEQAAVNNVAAAPLTVPTPAAAPQAQGPVVLTAADRVWIEVKDGGVILKQGELAAGDTFQVPADAAEPTLTTAKSEALRITVGTAVAPVIGPPAEKVTVSLKPADLLQPRPAASTPTRPAAPPPVAATRAEPPAAEPAANATVPAQPSQQ
jgi:cytoskeletal protein RodZ